MALEDYPCVTAVVDLEEQELTSRYVFHLSDAVAINTCAPPHVILPQSCQVGFINYEATQAH